MAVTIYKGGKYRTLVGKKVSKNSNWITLPSNAKIKANGKWYKLGFKKTSSDVVEPDFPELPELNGPILTEETLVHLNIEEPTVGNIFYMTPVGNGNMDGSSWENAYSASNIHVILLQVTSGDRIYMSEGDYGTISRSMTIPEGVSIYGGFIEGDYNWNTRDAFNHQTVWNGDGTFALFDLTSENINQEIDGITCVNFKNEINESGNVTFRNMVLSNGTFKVLTGLTNSKSYNCELEIGGDVDTLYNVCNQTTNCTINESLSNSTIDLSGGDLSSHTTNQIYASNCLSINVNSLSDSESVNCNIISYGTVENVKCYNGDLTSTDGDCNNCIVKGNLNSEHGNCESCQVEGNLTCGGNCESCQVEGNLTCGGNCSNCKSKGLRCDTSRNCVCYNLCSNGIGENDIIINSITNAKTIKTQPYQTDDSIQCDYYILSGFLYYKDNTKVGIEYGWTNISGYSDSSTSAYAYGIRDGYLYVLQGTTYTKISKESGWTNISGYSSSGTHYSYGIREGYLYSLKETIATQISQESGWTNISGYSTYSSDSNVASSTYAYGIRNGYLYSLRGTTVKQISTEMGWTHVAGVCSQESFEDCYAYGIRDGYLYLLQRETAAQISTEGWTHVCGKSGKFYNSTNHSTYYLVYSYGIREGYLYSLQGGVVTKISQASGWTNISGYSVSTPTYSNYAYGIRNGYLYCLIETTETQISEESSWTHVAGSYSDYGSNSIYAYGIMDGYLYNLGKNVKNLIKVFFSHFSNCVFLNCEIDNGTIENSKIYNSKLKIDATNSLIVNCEGDIKTSTYSTIVNSKSSVLSGDYNVYWNNEGSITPNNNAQSKYDESNLLTLDNDNSIARFTSTGYSPSIGIQDLGDCPDPISDEEGYNNYVNSFGNFVPQSNSFLIGKGIKDSNITKDLNGKERPENPTLGAYEPIN